MNPNQELIEEFYAGFASGHPDTMASCYHPEAVFRDPVFGALGRKDAVDMWHFLIERADGRPKVEFANIEADDLKGSAHWIARYHFSKTGREVVNEVKASFEFRDGLIYRHADHFDFWKWSGQALGITGKLLGWSGFLKKKISRQALMSLRKFQEVQGA